MRRDSRGLLLNASAQEPEGLAGASAIPISIDIVAVLGADVLIVVGLEIDYDAILSSY